MLVTARGWKHIHSLNGSPPQALQQHLMLPCLHVLAHPRASLLLMDNLCCSFFAVMFCFMLDKVFELVLGSHCSDGAHTSGNNPCKLSRKYHNCANNTDVPWHNTGSRNVFLGWILHFRDVIPENPLFWPKSGSLPSKLSQSPCDMILGLFPTVGPQSTRYRKFLMSP